MATSLNTLEVPIDEAALLLRVQPQTIRRRLSAGDLVNKRDGRKLNRDVVELDPTMTRLRVEDAGAMLGVTAATVRAMISRGELAGVRERGGRWKISLGSVLAHPRCDPELVARFGGEPGSIEPVSEPLTGPAPAHRLRRTVRAELDVDELELLERAVDRHGTVRAAIVAGLLATADEDATPGETAELRVERDLYRDEAERASERAQTIAELARRHHVDELHCPRCERLVPIAEVGYVVDDEGHVALYHEPHGYRERGRVRSSTVMARRHEAPAEDSQVPPGPEN